MGCSLGHCGCLVIPGSLGSAIEKDDVLPPDASNYGINDWTDWTCGVMFPDGKDEAWAWKLDLSNRVGMCDIYFETYSQRDRLLVWVDKNLYLDSGCIGTDDDVVKAPFQTVPAPVDFRGTTWKTSLYIPSGLKRMWIAVLPNCEGGSGTLWKIKVDCPDGNRHTNDRRILKAYRTFKQNEGNYEHIAQEWS